MIIFVSQEQIVKLQKDCRAIQQKLEKKVDCLNQQVYEYEKQTEQVFFLNICNNYTDVNIAKSFTCRCLCMSYCV